MQPPRPCVAVALPVAQHPGAVALQDARGVALTLDSDGKYLLDVSRLLRLLAVKYTKKIKSVEINISIYLVRVKAQ